LQDVDGVPIGTFETNLSDWRVGSELIASGNRTFRIVGIVDDADVFMAVPVGRGQVRLGD
jgi:hypothetical protein